MKNTAEFLPQKTYAAKRLQASEKKRMHLNSLASQRDASTAQ